MGGRGGVDIVNRIDENTGAYIVEPCIMCHCAAKYLAPQFGMPICKSCSNWHTNRDVEQRVDELKGVKKKRVRKKKVKAPEGQPFPAEDDIANSIKDLPF